MPIAEAIRMMISIKLLTWAVQVLPEGNGKQDLAMIAAAYLERQHVRLRLRGRYGR